MPPFFLFMPLMSLDVSGFFFLRIKWRTCEAMADATLAKQPAMPMASRASIR